MESILCGGHRIAYSINKPLYCTNRSERVTVPLVLFNLTHLFLHHSALITVVNVLEPACKPSNRTRPSEPPIVEVYLRCHNSCPRLPLHAVICLPY
jgi:hypothetical protein